MRAAGRRAVPGRLARLARAGPAVPTATFVVVLALWEAGVRLFDVPSFVLPAPSRILGGYASIPFGRWVEHVWATLRVALAGYFLSIALAVPIAVLLTRSPLLSRALYPLLVIVQSTPVVAIAPIVIVVMGVGDAPRIVITCLITFFPIVVATTTGLLATPPELVELSRSLRAPTRREILQVRLPYAVPYLFSALKISITLAVIGAVVAEFVAADAGLGYFIQFSTSMFQIQQSWAGLIVLVALSLALFQLVALVQRVWFAWSLPKASQGPR